MNTPIQKCYAYPIMWACTIIIKLKRSIKTYILKELPPKKFNWRESDQGTDAIECDIDDLFYVSGKFHDSLYLYDERVLILTGVSTIGDRRGLKTELIIHYDINENIDLDKLALSAVFSLSSARKDKNHLSRSSDSCWNFTRCRPNTGTIHPDAARLGFKKRPGGKECELKY